MKSQASPIGCTCLAHKYFNGSLGGSATLNPSLLDGWKIFLHCRFGKLLNIYRIRSIDMVEDSQIRCFQEIEQAKSETVI